MYLPVPESIENYLFYIRWVITVVFISLVIFVINLACSKICEKCNQGTANKCDKTIHVRYHKGQDGLNDLEQVTIDEDDLHKKKQSDDKAERPNGFPQLGNTCFMNAILQNLVWTPRIEDSLCNNDKNDAETALVKLVKNAHNGYGRTIEQRFLMNVLNAARRHNDQFHGNEQQDSFEMFNTLVGAIQDDRLKCNPFEKTADSKNSELKHIMENCPLTRLFGGMFMTIYLYESCSHVDLKFQMFTSINVPVPKKRIWGKHGHSKGGNDSETNTDSDNDMFWPSKKEELKTLQGINRDNELTGIEHGLIELTGIKEYEEKMLPCNKCKPKIPGYCSSGKTIQKLLVLTPPPVLVLQINGFETLIFCVIACSHCWNIIQRTKLFTDKLLNQRYWKPELFRAKKNYTRHHNIVHRYDFPVSKLTMLIFDTTTFHDPSIFNFDYICDLCRHGLEDTGLRKINGKVSFPEVLNISPYCSAAYKVTEMSSESTTLLYNLYGVVAHDGTLNGGHYFAYVKTAKRDPEKLFEKFIENHDFTDPKIAYESKILNFFENESTLENDKNYADGQPGTPMENHAQGHPYNESTWYCISDSQVMVIKIQDVLKIDNASILFYERGPSTTNVELYSETAV